MFKDLIEFYFYFSIMSISGDYKIAKNRHSKYE